MQLTEELILNIMVDFELNKAQFELLKLSYPPQNGWDNEILNIEISQRTHDLLVLLRGKLPLKTQQQIINNYDFLQNLKNNTNTSKNNYDKVMGEITSIFCDGACKNNPGEAGSGIAVYYKSRTKPKLYLGNYEKNGTNNIAELNALKKSLEIVKNSFEVFTITIYSDSQYAINCIQVWAKTWEKNNWKRNDGPIKNLDLIKSCYYLYKEVEDCVEIKHVKAHSGIEGNELADRMAVYAIKTKNTNFLEYEYSNMVDVLNMESSH